MVETLSWLHRLSQIGTRLMTLFFGHRVGVDGMGNVYCQSRRTLAKGAAKRWVLYAGVPDPTQVPPEWSGWLRGTCDAPLPTDGASVYFWRRPHQPNLTGTGGAYLPPGHELSRMAASRVSRTSSNPRVWEPLDELK